MIGVRREPGGLPQMHDVELEALVGQQPVQMIGQGARELLDAPIARQGFPRGRIPARFAGEQAPFPEARLPVWRQTEKNLAHHRLDRQRGAGQNDMTAGEKAFGFHQGLRGSGTAGAACGGIRRVPTAPYVTSGSSGV